ncbi:hypothetical protein OIU84_021596 [Salix udensis]|uniref:ALOG domain-containing protein n=1 Tax=Salix udensis TaxID=889485 RepID=A0AAD6KV84_9ROSI|nr:hypothetical protein OIU84_021596 [Salix udensis]
MEWHAERQLHSRVLYVEWFLDADRTSLAGSVARRAKPHDVAARSIRLEGRGQMQDVPEKKSMEGNVYHSKPNNHTPPRHHQHRRLPLLFLLHHHHHHLPPSTLSRYENQKRRDWNTFGQYLRNHRPPLSLSRCSGAHVLEFLRYLDQFGKTKVHTQLCPFFGYPNPPAPCPCPLRQAWGSLDALIGRLRAAFEEHGGKPENNPFGARAVRLYLREVRDSQSKARGISYEKKKRKRPPAAAESRFTDATTSTTREYYWCK